MRQEAIPNNNLKKIGVNWALVLAYWLDWFKSWLFKFFHWSYVSAKVHLVYFTSSSLSVTNSVWPLLLIYAVLTMWGVVTIHTIWIVRLMNIQIHVSIKELEEHPTCCIMCLFLLLSHNWGDSKVHYLSTQWLQLKWVHQYCQGCFSRQSLL